MPADGTEVRVKFKISPFEEMPKDRKAQFEKNQALRKRFPDWEIDETLFVASKLRDGRRIEQDVRLAAKHDLKTFDQRVEQEYAKAEKDSSSRAEANALIRIDKHYEATGRIIRQKTVEILAALEVEIAVDELQEEDAPATEAPAIHQIMRLARGVIGRIEAFDPLDAFRATSREAARALDRFQGELAEELAQRRAAEKPESDASWDDDRLQIAVRFCEENMRQARELFRARAELGVTAVAALGKIAEKTLETKGTPPDLSAFAREIRHRSKSSFAPWLREVKTYQAACDMVIKVINKQDIDEPMVTKVRPFVADVARGTEASELLGRDFRALARRFREIERTAK